MIPETYYEIYPYNLAKHMLENVSALDNLLPGKLIEEVDNSLSEREAKCIKLRFFEGKKLDEIASEFNVTRERIRQIIAKAERKLRNPARSDRYMAVPAYSMKKAQIKIMELEHYIKLYENSNPASSLSNLAVSSTPIEELELSVRSYNCLKRAGFNILGKFEFAKLCDIAKIRNLGSKSFYEIMEKLSEIGFFASDGTELYPLTKVNDFYSKDVIVWRGVLEKGGTK